MQHSERPEYTYDYHWGRIAFAAALLVGLGIGAYQLIFSSNDETTKAQHTIVKTEAVNEEITPLEATQPVERPTEPTTEIAEETQKTDSAEIKTAQFETKEIKEESTKESVIDIISSTEIKVERTSAKPSDTRTKAELFTAAIKRAKLTAQVKRREPGDSLPQDLALDSNGISKVYFYTEVIGQAGKTHYHHWYRDGKLQAKVPITIGSDRWRCYSSKYLTHEQTGEWTVKVKDAKGKLLAQSDFNFINQ